MILCLLLFKFSARLALTLCFCLKVKRFVLYGFVCIVHALIDVFKFNIVIIWALEKSGGKYYSWDQLREFRDSKVEISGMPDMNRGLRQFDD